MVFNLNVLYRLGRVYNTSLEVGIMKKKYGFSLVLAMGLMFALTGCGGATGGQC